MIMFPDTRFSMANWVLWAACLFALWNRKERDRSEVVAWSALTILMIPALFLIHHRTIGFSLPHELIFETMSETVQSTVFGVLFIVAGAWLAHGLHERRFFSTRMGVVMFCYGLLPILMYPKSNTVDWAVLIALMGAAIFGIRDVLRSGVDSNRLLEFTIIGWLTIAWGGWAGAVTLAVIAITERLLDGPWGELLERRQHPVAEHARIAILVLLPLALWFLIWASLGQVEGVFYPRELNPGNIILRGGYIGDRASPSNEWVGFMGASPAFLLIFLLWRAFHRSGWPLHLLGGMLLIRHSLLWLHLSMAANLPRLVFKATWDSIFSILLVLMLAPFVIEQWLAAAPESEAEAIEVESHSG